MRLLLDTHVLLWAARGGLDGKVQSILDDTANELLFSPVSLWEIELKRAGLRLEPKAFYQSLIAHGYKELVVTTRHVLFLGQLPLLHRDPFDRMLLAQALGEQVYLFTADERLQQYSQHLDCVLCLA